MKVSNLFVFFWLQNPYKLIPPSPKTKCLATELQNALKALRKSSYGKRMSMSKFTSRKAVQKNKKHMGHRLSVRRHKVKVEEEKSVDEDEVVIENFISTLPNHKSKLIYVIINPTGQDVEARLRATNLPKLDWIKVYTEEEAKKHSCRLICLVIAWFYRY